MPCSFSTPDPGRFLSHSSTKIGWSSDPNPQLVYPSVVGRSRLVDDNRSHSINDMMFGVEAWQARKYLDLNYPIENGIIKSWEDCHLLWKHGFDALKIKPSGTSILVTEAVRNPDSNKDKLGELIFEKFGFSGMQVQLQAILSMYSEGRMTSCILDSGDGVSNIIPIVDGYVINSRIKKSELAGKEVTKYLTKLLFLKGYAFNSSADFETVKEIKEKLCFVSSDIALDRKLANETVYFEQEYTLPDGTLVRVGSCEAARKRKV